MPAVDDYYGVVRDSFVAAAEAQGVSYFEGNGDGAADPTQQIAKIETMLAQGIDVLAVAPPGDAFRPVLDRAKELGVKVIFIDQQVPDWDGESTFIATDSNAGSQQLGDYLAPMLTAGDKVGIMIGIPGIPLLFDRYNNFKTTLEAAGIEVILSSEADGCQLDTAVNVARNFIVANPDLAAIYSLCGPTGVAVTQVLQEQGNPARASRGTCRSSRSTTSSRARRPLRSPSSRSGSARTPWSTGSRSRPARRSPPTSTTGPRS